MTIEFPCSCGKQLSVPDDAAGRRAKCPRCGTVVNVPGTPPPPPPPTTDIPKMSKVDEMMDRLGMHLAESQDRAPQLTKVALGIGGLAIATFFLTLIIGFFNNVVVWVLVWMPVCVAGMAMVVGMIKADHRTPRLVRTAAPVLVGISWAILWTSAVPGEGGISFSTALIALIALCNAGGYAFLYWYIGRPWMAVFFPEPARIAEIKDDNNSQPAEGSVTK